MDMVYVPESGAMAARQRIIRRLRADGATSAGSARGLEPKNRLERKGLERAVRCGMIRRTEGGTFWVDETRVAECRAKELRFLLIGLLFMLLVLGILYVLGEFS